MLHPSFYSVFFSIAHRVREHNAVSMLTFLLLDMRKIDISNVIPQVGAALHAQKTVGVLF